MSGVAYMAGVGGVALNVRAIYAAYGVVAKAPASIMPAPRRVMGFLARIAIIGALR